VVGADTSSNGFKDWVWWLEQTNADAKSLVGFTGRSCEVGIHCQLP